MPDEALLPEEALLPDERRRRGRAPGTPLYRKISEGLRQRIQAGDWSPGQVLPPRRKLSQELGTTRITLDKAISELVNEGYLSATIGSGTYVVDRRTDNGASPIGAVPSGRLERLGVVLGTGINNDPTSSVVESHVYFGGIFRGIREALMGTEVGVSYFQVDAGNYMTLLDRPMDAYIIIAPEFQDLPVFRMISQHMPIVVIGISPTFEGDAHLPCIDTDNISASRDATNYLLDLGHKSIGIVNLAMSHGNHFDRLQGYLDAMATHPEAVQSFSNVLLYPAYDPTVWSSLIESWLARLQAADALPTAIFASDSDMTLSTLQALRKAGLRVPEDVSLVGFDDPQVMRHTTPAITTVRQPAQDMGRRAAVRLLDRFSAGSPLEDLAGIERLPCELVERESATRREA